MSDTGKLVLRLIKVRLKENHKVGKGLGDTCTALGSFRMTLDVQHKLTHHAHSASIPETRAYFCQKKSMGSKVKQKSRKKVKVNPLFSLSGKKRSLNTWLGCYFRRDFCIYRVINYTIENRTNSNRRLSFRDKFYNNQ